MTTLPDHTIKINRALHLSSIGPYPASASAMLAAIPAQIITALTARQIAMMLDAMWTLAQASKAIAIKDALSEGAVWDGEKHREIAA